jgi:LPS sulfotransferase NodH
MHPPPTTSLREPLFVVSAPRAGSTLLAWLLTHCDALWHLGRESRRLLEAVGGLHPRAREWHSGRLDAAAATPATIAALHEALARELRRHDGARLADLPPAARPAAVRFFDKSPEHALRVPFLAAAFPDARFVFLHRDPRESIASLIEAWTVARATRARFVAYDDVPGWDGPWAMVLPPGWRALAGRPLAAIAAAQWRACNTHLMDDLAALPPERVLRVTYRDLVGDPRDLVARACDFAAVPVTPRLAAALARPLPYASTTVTPPAPDKWRRHADAIAAVWPEVVGVAARLGYA